MILPAFELHTPRDVDEALSIAPHLRGDWLYIAGGTDILPNLYQNLNSKRHFISLAKIESLKAMRPNALGSGVTLAELIRVPNCVPAVLKGTAKLIAGPAIREAATVGGNLLLTGRCRYFNRSELARCADCTCLKAGGEECIVVPQKDSCYAPFSGDLAPVCLVLGAKLRIVGPEGERVIALREFYCPDGIHSNVLSPHEILTEVVFPEDAQEMSVKYLKLRARSAMDFPEAGVCVGVKRVGDKLSELRVAIGALGPKPVFLSKRGEDLAGIKNLEEQIWKELNPEVVAVRNSSFRPNYRKEMARVFLRRLLAELV